jgi:hypothetical protein
MYDLATALVFFQDLPAEFQRIAQAYQPEVEIPGPFWAVVYNGKVIAIYLDPKEAFAHMMAVKLDMDAGREPKRQEYKDVATVSRKLKQVMEKHKNDSDSGLNKKGS